VKPRTLVTCILLAAVHVSIAAAQTDQPLEPPAEAQTVIQPKYRLMPASFDILRDERTLWKDTFRIGSDERKWVLPIVLVNALAISTDAAAYQNITPSKTIQEASHVISSLGAPYPLFAAGVSMYLLGRHTDDSRLRETGILGTQALVHSVIFTAVLEAATNRKQPNGSGEADFWNGGDAWPSGHAAMFWALSTVVAEQYDDRPMLRFGAYSLATAVSVSRFTGRQHFPSDAVASSVLGYLVGRWVVHHRSSTYHRDQ
jgi:membrane-associated phospholipid phosphatase